MSRHNEMRLLGRLAKPAMGLGAGLGLPAGGSGLSTPALDLNFLTGTLDSRITFTRGSAGTFVNAQGLIESAGANVPRFDHDPVTLAPKGLLIEEARTNLFSYSQAFENAAWSRNGATATDSSATSPDGTSNATLVTWTTENYPAIYRTVATSNGSAHFFGVFAKAGNSGTLTLELRNSGLGAAHDCLFTLSGLGSAAVNGGAIGGPTGGIIAWNNGWYLCYVIKTTSNTTPVAIVGRGDGASAGDTIYLWQADLQVGGFRTSPIPTLASQESRLADGAEITGSNFSNWFNRPEGTLYADYIINGIGTAVVFGMDDLTANNYHRILPFSGGLNGKTIVGGVPTDIIAAQPTLGVRHKSMYAYNTNDFALVTDGGSVSTNSSGAANPLVTRAVIGVGAGSLVPFAGCVRALRYFRKRLSNSVIISMTV